jgi:Mrp family chromosome partitioning ATPase
MRTPSLDKPKPPAAAKPSISCLPPALAPYCQAVVNRLGLAAPTATAPHALGFTSCARRAGVSTLASGLASLVASSGLQVLLVDARWQNPVLARRFGISPAPGLWELLAGDASDNLALVPTDLENLCLLPCGRKPAEGLLLASAAALAGRINGWKERFDLIVLDLPPAMPEEPLMAWTGVLDGVLLVLEAERTVALEAKQARKTLLDCDARLLGAVLNKQRSYLPRWLF